MQQTVFTHEREPMTMAEPELTLRPDRNGGPGGDRRRLPSLAILIGVALLAAACSSSAAASSTTGTSSKGPFVKRSGTGDATIASTTLPSRAIVSWTFDCNSPSKTGTFVLSTSKSGGAAMTLTNQTGLGGNGHKALTSSGRYGFTVKTPCSWTLIVGTKLPKPAVVTTTTAATTTTTAPTTSST